MEEIIHAEFNEMKINKNKNTPKELDNRIKIGRETKENGRKPIYIPENSRKGNTLILGSKLSGKSSYILPYLAKQDMVRKNAGCTFIVSKKDLAYTLYAIAKMETKKKVHLIKPSCDLNIANTLLRDTTEYEYDVVKNIINFKDVIKKKEIVIIDMENSKYHQDAVRAVAKLLIQLQVDMQDVASTIKRDHFIYIDDAQYYLPFLDSLLNYGDDYNMYTTLFMQGRNQYQIYGEDYTALLDNNIRNYILMNGINFKDAQYFAPFFEVSPSVFLQRQAGTFSVAYVDDRESMRFVPSCEVLTIPKEDAKKIEERSKKERKKLVKTVNQEERAISVISQGERKGFNALHLDEAVEESLNKKTVKEEVVKTQQTVTEAPKATETAEIIKEDLKPVVEIEKTPTKLIEPTIQLPDIGIEDDEESYLDDGVELDSPDFLQDIDDELQDIEELVEVEEPKEVTEAPVLEETFIEVDEPVVEEVFNLPPAGVQMIVEETSQAIEDDYIRKPMTAYEYANSRLQGKKATFAPRKRADIEKNSVENFYSAVLGDKFGAGNWNK